jgi:hypothetical protein
MFLAAIKTNEDNVTLKYSMNANTKDVFYSKKRWKSALFVVAYIVYDGDVVR